MQSLEPDRQINRKKSHSSFFFLFSHFPIIPVQDSPLNPNPKLALPIPIDPPLHRPQHPLQLAPQLAQLARLALPLLLRGPQFLLQLADPRLLLRLRGPDPREHGDEVLDLLLLDDEVAREFALAVGEGAGGVWRGREVGVRLLCLLLLLLCGVGIGRGALAGAGTLGGWAGFGLLLLLLLLLLLHFVCDGGRDRRDVLVLGDFGQ